MKTEPRIKTKSRGSDSFRTGVRAAVRGYWNGSMDFMSFVNSLLYSIRYGYQNAWYEGARSVGILPTELTQDEIRALENEITSQSQYIYGLADAIEANSKERGGKLTPLLQRSDMWVNRYEMIYGLAIQMAGRDKKVLWKWNPDKEHCPDCLRLNGRIYRASTWKRYNLYPRMHGLRCGGWRCGCEFVVTSDPVTPGRPPDIGK